MFGCICVNKRHPCINLILYNIPIFTHDMIYEKKTFLSPHRRKITDHLISTMHFPVLSIFLFTHCFDCLFVLSYLQTVWNYTYCLCVLLVHACGCMHAYFSSPSPFLITNNTFFRGKGLKRIELQKISIWNRSWISRNHIENYSLFLY